VLEAIRFLALIRAARASELPLGRPFHLYGIFLLDTQTGRVWKYVASGQPKMLKDKDQTTDLSGGSTTIGLTPGTFVPVDRIEFAAPKASNDK
jgi:hypothetical protein